MVFFRKKKLKPTKRVCLCLRETRKKMGVSLNDLARRTKIDKKFLKALEQCRFDDLPTGLVYKKNFVKRYIKALKLDPKPYLQQFIDEEVVCRPDLQTDHPKAPVKSHYLSNWPQVLRIVSVGLLFTCVFVYLGFQVKKIMEPPKLTVLSPIDGYISHESNVDVIGQTEGKVTVSINGKDVSNDEAGQFSESIDLNPGLNTLVITAQKKSGKKVSQTRYVILKE